ncbi:MAG TPA: hypothetical protein VFJ30_10170 [Phycisphaerae bacterium]|nr:hypothetical protein [Phycisphaerae bacterium]
MRHKKVVATLVGVCVVTCLLIGYAVAQDRRPMPPEQPSGRGSGFEPSGPAGRTYPSRSTGGRSPMSPDMAYGGPVPPGVPQAVERMSVALELVGRMREACFDPSTAGMIAIGGLKDDVRRTPKDAAADLEEQLAKTKTLGLRNAIRMELKELYKRLGEDEKLLKNLRAMLAENDEALQAKDKGLR